MQQVAANNEVPRPARSCPTAWQTVWSLTLLRVLELQCELLIRVNLGRAATWWPQWHWQKLHRQWAGMCKEQHVAATALVLAPGVAGANTRVVKARKAARRPCGGDTWQGPEDKDELREHGSWVKEAELHRGQGDCGLRWRKPVRGEVSLSWLMDGLKGSCPEWVCFFPHFWFPFFMYLSQSKQPE